MIQPAAQDKKPNDTTLLDEGVVLMARVRSIDDPEGNGPYAVWTIRFDDGGVISTAQVKEAPIVGGHPDQESWHEKSLWWVRLHKEGQERTYYIVEKPVSGDDVNLWALRAGDSKDVALWKTLAVAVVDKDDFRH